MRGKYNQRSDLKNQREEQQKADKAYRMAEDLCTAILVLCVASLILFAMSSCTTTKYVEVEKVRTDTVYKSKVERDSVWLHDSVEVNVKGDTVLVEKWHTKIKETFVYDTLQVLKKDSIPVPYPVTKYVEKELSWWQQTCMYIAYAVIALLVIFFGWKIVKNKLF